MLLDDDSRVFNTNNQVEEDGQVETHMELNSPESNYCHFKACPSPRHQDTSNQSSD